mmetsp:Transcript_167780/g.533462  ORF Transcript_167780/g.533462 Transcript_167780/m.533462 type:complete len:254 (-) Transcript_167780:49-810(-)
MVASGMPASDAATAASILAFSSSTMAWLPGSLMCMSATLYARCSRTNLSVSPPLSGCAPSRTAVRNAALTSSVVEPLATPSTCQALGTSTLADGRAAARAATRGGREAAAGDAPAKLPARNGPPMLPNVSAPGTPRVRATRPLRSPRAAAAAARAPTEACKECPTPDEQRARGRTENGHPAKSGAEQGASRSAGRGTKPGVAPADRKATMRNASKSPSTANVKPRPQAKPSSMGPSHPHGGSIWRMSLEAETA